MNTQIVRTEISFHFSHDNFDAILKMLAHLSSSIFSSMSNHCSLIGHDILLYNLHKYCMISFIHVREINEQNGMGYHEWCTVASSDDYSHVDRKSYRTPLMLPTLLCSLISRTCINDIMQYLWKLSSNISCPIRLQWFDFEANIDADKWANIFKIASKLS